MLAYYKSTDKHSTPQSTNKINIYFEQRQVLNNVIEDELFSGLMVDGKAAFLFNYHHQLE